MEYTFGYTFSFTVDSIWSKMLSIKIYFKTTENKIYDKKIVLNVKGFLQKKKKKCIECKRLFTKKKKTTTNLKNGQKKIWVGRVFGR